MMLNRAWPGPTRRWSASHVRCPSGPRWASRRVARSRAPPAEPRPQRETDHREGGAGVGVEAVVENLLEAGGDRDFIRGKSRPERGCAGGAGRNRDKVAALEAAFPAEVRERVALDVVLLGHRRDLVEIGDRPDLLRIDVPILQEGLVGRHSRGDGVEQLDRGLLRARRKMALQQHLDRCRKILPQRRHQPFRTPFLHGPSPPRISGDYSPRGPRARSVGCSSWARSARGAAVRGRPVAGLITSRVPAPLTSVPLINNLKSLITCSPLMAGRRTAEGWSLVELTGSGPRQRRYDAEPACS